MNPRSVSFLRTFSGAGRLTGMTNAIQNITNERGIDSLLENARARVADGWKVWAVHPDGVTMSHTVFGRTTVYRIATRK